MYMCSWDPKKKISDPRKSSMVSIRAVSDSHHYCRLITKVFGTVISVIEDTVHILLAKINILKPEDL